MKKNLSMTYDSLVQTWEAANEHYMIIEAHLNGQIFSVNEKFLKETRAHKNEILGKNLAQLFFQEGSAKPLKIGDLLYRPGENKTLVVKSTRTSTSVGIVDNGTQPSSLILFSVKTGVIKKQIKSLDR